VLVGVAGVVDGEYDIPFSGSCQGIDSFTPTVSAVDELPNVIKALTAPDGGTVVSWSDWRGRTAFRGHATTHAQDARAMGVRFTATVGC
jgi:hypothetical protein